MSDVTETELKRELLEMDVKLRGKQVVWETPRNIAILAGAIAAVAGVVSGYIGYKIGSAPPAPPIIIQMPAQK